MRFRALPVVSAAVSFAVTTVVVAMAAPSIASASSWGPINTTHVLDAPTLTFTAHMGFGSTYGWQCTNTQLDADVRNAADFTVTNSELPTDCRGTDSASSCTITMKATRLDWTITGDSPSNITIQGVHIDVRVETIPPGGGCFVRDTTPALTVTGTLGGGTWNANEHAITFGNATGLTAHNGSGNFAVTVTGTFRDTTQTLTLT
jgi:hypothetical protein